ncbi:hypothetical protein [Clostridium sporogenes]
MKNMLMKHGLFLSTEVGRAKNRRVEIAIVRKYPSPPVTKEIDKDKNKK